MVRSRVLVALAIALCGAVFMCTRPLRGVSVAGQFIDDRTGEPVAGVQIYVSYGFMTAPYNLALPRVKSAGYNQGFSGPDGRFRIDGKPIKGMLSCAWSNARAHLTWVHKRYGWGDVSAPTTLERNPRHLVIRMRPDPDQLSHFADPQRQESNGPCARGGHWNSNCRRYAYGDPLLD